MNDCNQSIKDMSWESNYSCLLRNIEGSISNHDDRLEARENISSPISKKRALGEVFYSGDISAHNHSILGEPIETNIQVLRLTAEIDEFKLQVEKLNDNICDLHAEQGREKERTIRQLEFMENDNCKLKKSLTENNERYYEEKRRWQAKTRLLELQIQEAKTDLASKDGLISSSQYAAIKSTSSNRTNREIPSLALDDFEVKLQESSKRIQALLYENHAWEEKCSVLEQMIATLQASGGESDETKETRNLRKKYSDLEHTLRKKCKEIELLEKRIQNQTLLEQELSVCRAKLSFTESSLVKANELLSPLQQLQDKEDLWNSLFSDLISKKYRAAGVSGSSGISPGMVYKAMGDLQQQCVTLTKLHSDAENVITSLKKTKEQLECSNCELKKERDEVDDARQKLEASARVHQQLIRLYDGEIASVRAQLQSYDVEFRIGRPSNERSLQLKDSVIETLRSEVDACRREARAIAAQAANAATLSVEVKRLSELVQTRDKTKPPPPPPPHPSKGDEQQSSEEALKTAKEEIASLREQVSDLKQQLRCLQRDVGIDYIPSRTKVLHMVLNPAGAAAEWGARQQPRGRGGDAAGGRGGGKNILDELKHLRAENRRLQTLCLQRTDEDEGSRGDSSGEAGGGVSLADLSTVGGRGTSCVASVASTALLGGLDSTKMNKRLKEMFRERISIFREAVYLLTGYKACMHACTQSYLYYAISSLYSLRQ